MKLKIVVPEYVKSVIFVYGNITRKSIKIFKEQLSSHDKS